MVLAASAALAAQAPDEVVKWSATKPAAVKPGAVANFDLSARIEAGWHLYALVQPDGGPPPMAIAAAKGQPFTIDASRIDAPTPAAQKNEKGDPESFHYEEKVTLSVPIAAPAATRPGTHRVPVEVTYQVCSGSICLRPTTVTVPVSLTVAR
jgi:DsbC/DsbD-like thiol-disulfide interchange protein